MQQKNATRTMARRTLALAAVFGCLLALAWGQAEPAPAAAATPPVEEAPKEDVNIAWEQTEETLTFTFETTGTVWTQFFYNTTKSGDNSCVRIVFQNDQKQKFMRLHLSSAVIGQDTRAQVTSTGSMLVLKKATPGMWGKITYLTTDIPLSSTVNVTMPTGDIIGITAFEYQDLTQAADKALRAAPGGDNIAEGSAEQVSALLLRAVERSTPICVAEDFCICTLPLVFDGVQCVDGTPWQKSSHVLSANTLPYMQAPETEGEKPQVAFLGPRQLLELSDGDFATVFNDYQQDVAAAPRWPYLMYAQTMAGWKVLVMGAGLAYFEPLIFAQHGANITLVDSNAANLQLVERLRKASNVPQSLVHPVEYKGVETLAALPGDFDAVLVLDSLTRSPVELLSGEYVELLKRVAPGGRWLQLAPSKTRYLQAGKPLLLNFGGTSGPLETRWADWLDLSKLVRLLAPMQPTFHVVFNTELGSHPPKGSDTFQWLDLLYLGSKLPKT